MKTISNLASVFACLTIIPQLALAIPQHAKRQETASTIAASPSATVDTAAGPTLEPVVPPQQDTGDLDVLNPDKSVQLSYAGVTTGPLTKRDDSVILVNFDFTFKYPTVALDHSDYITSISCSADGQLTGQITDPDAYALAKENWSQQSNLILITAVQSCGNDTQNDVFVATSFDFSDDDDSFAATGSHVTFHDVLRTMDVKWGNAPSDTLSKRFAHQRRAKPDYTASATLDIGLMVSEGISAEEDPPWPGAVLLASWSTDGTSEEGGSEKRELATSKELAVRAEGEGGFEAGLSLYCVDCGIKGTVTIEGSLSWGILSGLTLAKVKVNGNLYAGMYLGLEMHAVYTQEWQKDIFKKSLNPWSVPYLIDFGPYVRLAVEASIEIKAEGTILIGASATWGQFEAYLDLVHGARGSSTSGLTPTIDRKAEAEVELSAEATLGMPIGIGVEISIFGFLTSALTVGCELTDTPAITAEASYSISVGKDEDEEDEEGEDTCDGIDWSIKLENKLEFSVTGYFSGSWDLIDPWESEPLADGCIQIGGSDDGGDDGSGDNGDDGSTGGDDGSNGDDDGTTGPPAPTKAKCVARNTNVPAAFSCRAVGTGASDTTTALLGPSQAKKRRRCVKRCMANDSCQSISWSPTTQTCQMYGSMVSDIGITPAKGQGHMVFGDRSCWRVTDCTTS